MSLEVRTNYCISYLLSLMGIPLMLGSFLVLGVVYSTVIILLHDTLTSD
jgi:hypothetical protein